MAAEGKQSESISNLRIEQVAGAVENTPDKVRTAVVEINTEEVSPSNGGASSADDQDDDTDEPSVLQALSSEQLARRPSFKRILDDLSSADATLKGSPDPLAAAATATVQAQQAALQQAAAAGLTNPALLPGLLQNMQNQIAASTSSAGGEVHIPQISMMLPSQQSLQLQSALLNASSGSQAPLIAGAVQTLAQTSLPANLLSSALLGNMAAAASLSSASPSVTAAVKSPGSSPQHSVLDDTTRKREIRLMKNREAARECRRKKKEYVRCLENRVAVLESQNQALIGELRALKELYLPKSNQE